MKWPLSGLRVADLSAGIAGGYCTKVLADGGAEVIKLEPPEGDRLRGWSAGTPDAILPVGGDQLDEHLAAWCATRDSAAIAETLCAAGVPAAAVLRQGEQADIPQLTARRFWEDVSHPVLGRYTAQAYPARLAAGPAVHNRRHSPMLGEHNEDILSGLLGMTAEEIAQLGQDGIIGTRPASADSSRGFT